MTWLKMGK